MKTIFSTQTVRFLDGSKAECRIKFFKITVFKFNLRTF